MARKPLLSGPVLNKDEVQSRLAGGDLMSRIIDNDREKNRPAPVDNLTELLINEQVNKPVNKSAEIEEGTYVADTAATAQPDPVTAAILASLAAPYAPPVKGEARVLVAGRVSREVSDRFELACTLLRKRGDKQDILDRALRVFLEHVVRESGDIDV